MSLSRDTMPSWELKAALDNLEVELRNVMDEAAQYKRSFNIRRNADMRAIKRWQESNPGNELTWPDHADLMVWLMEENDRLREALEFYANPETYHAMVVVTDPPCGEFAYDISDVEHDYYENSYGAKARNALKLNKKDTK